MAEAPTSSHELRHATAVAIDAARNALAFTAEHQRDAALSSKGDRDVVTTADVAVEDAVRAMVAEALGHGVVGEERGGDAGAGPAPYWLVDPICGTRNFASGIPLYCTNLALVEDGVVTSAVVGDASTGGVFAAERGRGAWVVDGDRLQRLTPSADSATVVIEDSHAAGTRREHAAEFVASAVRADRWDLRALSTTLALPYVAAGRVAAYVLWWTSAVHAAAGTLVAAEAGAFVSDLNGRPWTIASDSIVAAATQTLHRELLDLAAAAMRPPA
jgi:fructose-1,6-bisphosphatase/inositol monophosphatase family enzyme